MIDNITIIVKIRRNKHVELRINQPIYIYGLTFHPFVKKGEVINYRCTFRNLFLILRDDTLVIMNSLCKFYHGYNHVNFNYSELNSAINILENTLGIEIRNAKIASFEYGFVLAVQDPKEVYSNWGQYKNKEPQSMTYYGKEYGIQFENSTHKLKCYNKTFEAKRNDIHLDQNILRIEKRVTMSYVNSLARFKGTTISTLGDLCERKTLELLGSDLIDSLLKIKLKNIPKDYDKLSTSDLRVWGYMQYEPIKKAMSLLHREAFKSDRAKYNKIQNEYRTYNQDVFIEEVSFRVDECTIN